MKKNAWIIVNIQKNNAVHCAEKTVELLKKANINSYIDSELQGLFNGDCSAYFADKSTCIANADFIVAIGGDGTIIHSAKYALEKNIPILGINAGRMGFLAQLEISDIEYLPENLKKSVIEDRMALRADVHTKNGVFTYTAVNEVLLSKGNMGKIVDLDVTCQGKTVSSYRADGIIFSTSIGSTAYAMSAGGPVIDPSVNCISMTPICPHSIFARSIVFSEDKQLKIQSRFVNNSDDVQLYIDGEKLHTLDSSEYVTIRKADRCVKFICFENNEFYEILNKKIMTRG